VSSAHAGSIAGLFPLGVHQIPLSTVRLDIMPARMPRLHIRREVVKGPAVERDLHRAVGPFDGCEQSGIEVVMGLRVTVSHGASRQEHRRSSKTANHQKPEHGRLSS
jgi:hypothetical protein